MEKNHLINYKKNLKKIKKNRVAKTVSEKQSRQNSHNKEKTDLKKKEQPRTVLCEKCSLPCSLPNSSSGSAHNRSHIGPKAGGSLNLST